MGIFGPNIDKLKAKKDVPGLIKALNHRNWRISKDAADALADMGDPSAVELLIKALKDPDEDKRWRAVDALGDLSDMAVEPLIKAFKDQDKDVRRCAAKALGNIGGPRAVDSLINVLKDEDKGVRYRAAKTLGYIGDTRAVEPLINALKDQDEDVRENAVEALGKIGDSRAVEPLIVALNDDESGLQYSAIIALGDLGDSRAVEPVKKFLKSVSPFTAEFTLRDYKEAVKKLGINLIIVGPNTCKPYKNGRCVIRSRDTGPCSGDPNNWQSCFVVRETRKLKSYHNFWE